MVHSKIGVGARALALMGVSSYGSPKARICSKDSELAGAHERLGSQGAQCSLALAVAWHRSKGSRANSLKASVPQQTLVLLSDRAEARSVLTGNPNPGRFPVAYSSPLVLSSRLSLITCPHPNPPSPMTRTGSTSAAPPHCSRKQRPICVVIDRMSYVPSPDQSEDNMVE